jgi:hypothetical protein
VCSSDLHLVAVAERQARILETAGPLAVFYGTKPEDWIEWNGELVVSPRDVAETTGLDLSVATDEVKAWKSEPSFIGTWHNNAAPPVSVAAPLWQLDFDQIWDEDWG